MVQIMVQSHQQMEQLHTQARERILGSLTAAHRALLAQIVGNLAVSPNPDRDAAARQLDAALSPAEAQAIVATHNALKQQMQAIMENTMKQSQAILTPQQRASMPQGGQNMMYVHEGGGSMGPHGNAMEGHERDTAGSILLELSSGDEHHMMMMWGQHP
jgi:Spy/CpxP family protein refolding chaperone